MQNTKPKNANEPNSYSRRKFIASALIITAGAALQTSAIPSFLPGDQQGPFSQKPLGFKYDALEPHIDAKTMEIHYSKHHSAYINNLNKAVKGSKAETMSLHDILKNISQFDTTVRNNAGGHFNHELFWSILNPQKTTRSSEIVDAITKEFQSMENLKSKMNASALKVFGSGWTWLYVNHEGRLAIGNTPNQDNPLMDIAEPKGIPILGIDVWEHAYYLKYQNKRADYLEAVWNLINWGEVDHRYRAAR